MFSHAMGAVARPATLLLTGMAAFVLLATVSADTASASGGVGIYPTTVQFDDTVRGGEYFRTIGVRHGGSEDRTFAFEADGGIGSWFSFVDTQDRSRTLDSVVVPAGATQAGVQVLLRMRVPDDVPNGSYSGAVRVTTAVARPGGGTSAGASVSVGAEIAVGAVVSGEQRIAGAMVDASASDVEAGFPLRVRTTVQNLGNVRMNPLIRVAIMRNDDQMAEVEFSDEWVFPGELKTITPEWDTSGFAAGGYSAHVSVRIGEREIGNRRLNFSILPPGSITRQGVMESIALDGVPEPGAKVKAVAVFMNTGQVATRALFVGELYRGSTLVDAVTSVEKLIPPGSKDVLEIFLETPGTGSYTLRGKINFEGKETAVGELVFDVPGTTSGTGVVGKILSRDRVLTAALAVGGVAMAVALSSAVVLRRRRGSTAAET